MDSVWSVL
jgi:hypothetical protein